MIFNKEKNWWKIKHEIVELMKNKKKPGKEWKIVTEVKECF